MKTFAKVAALAATAAVSEASLTACSGADFNVAMKGFFQGMQADSTAISTGCYSATSTLAQKFNNVSANYYNLSFSDFLAPIYSTIEAGNAMVELFVQCETTNMAKQFSNRFTTWSGLLDLVSTIGVSFLKNYVYAQDSGNRPSSSLYDAANTFFIAPDCMRTSRALGQMLHYTVYFEIQDENYEEELQLNLAE